MTKQYPFLAADFIESKAEQLRKMSKYYVNDHQGAVTPIESIAEFDLGLGLDFDNIKETLKLHDSTPKEDQILGAIVFAEKRILIDETLDPYENPKVEGRFRFTIAHEIAHWVLHRHLFPDELNAVAMLQDGPQNYLLRQKTPNARLEWQADYFASCILMPRVEVERAWYLLTGRFRQFNYEASRGYLDIPFIENPWRQIGETIGFSEAGCSLSKAADDKKRIFNLISIELASQLNVSAQSMEIRLKELGWIR